MRPISFSDKKIIFKNKLLELYMISAYFKNFKKDYFVIDFGRRMGILILKHNSVLLVRQYRYLLSKIVKQATKAGIETIPTYFSANLAKKIRNERGHVSVILANNVLANIDNLSDTTEGIRELMSP
ncbi:MAG: hypothetical protein L6408_09635 [Nanoarchaeota archaeon]|nr:hypothetical protein [Nanoarchaeota archaeon]